MKLAPTLASVLAVTCCLIAACPTAAAPTLFGYTGLVKIPTADALNEKEYHVGVFTLNLEEGADSTIYAASLGLAEGLEVGFARHSPEEGAGQTYVNAKYTFLQDSEAHPALAAGVTDLTDQVESSPYIVASKALWGRHETRFGEVGSVRVHLGIGGGSLDGLFGGISAALGDRLLLMAEYEGERVNLGLRLAIGEYIRIHGAALDGFDDVGLGVSFNKRY